MDKKFLEENEIAKLLLQDCTCQNCKTLNPHEWPNIWCQHSKDAPSEMVCEKWIAKPQIRLNLKSYNIRSKPLKK